MGQERAIPLYTPQILALAVALADYPLGEDFKYTANARSRTCGSAISIGLDVKTDGAIASVGVAATACAIGQASAAIFLQDCAGRSASDIANALGAIEAWLAGVGPRPDWNGIEQLEPARQHPGRHGAIPLAWKAATLALCNSEEAG